MQFIWRNGAFEAKLVVILENISAKSFYYPIHESSPMEINPLYGIISVVVALSYPSSLLSLT